MRTRILLACALFEQHKVNQALQTIKEAIRLAAPENFLRPFLESRSLCVPLLSLALQKGNLTVEAQSFIKTVLQTSNSSGSNTPVSTAEIAALAESASISPREQEVLRLLCEGHSNREIAVKLSVSESTVKTHVGNIYYKLNVNSRIHAVTRAKELKLV
jgi:LuxR family maltose regulon positive regulatory protein